MKYTVRRDSSVGIAPLYGLDGPGIESRGGEIFLPVQTCCGPTHPMATGSLPRVKRLDRGIDHAPYLAPMLKKE